MMILKNGEDQNSFATMSTVHAPSQPALDYKPQILGPTFLFYVLNQSVILTNLDYKFGVKNMQTAGYNGVHTVHKDWSLEKETKVYKKCQ